MNSPKLLSLLALIGLFYLAGCATNPELHQQLLRIQSVGINNNVDFRGEGAEPDKQSQDFQQDLVREFVRQVNRAEIFPQPIVIVRTSLQTWREELGEMKYDAQFKLNIRPGTKEGTWVIEAICESRYGAVVWRSAKVVSETGSGLNQAMIANVCSQFAQELARARRV